MPLVNGYSDVIPADFREAAAVLDGFPSTDAFAVARAAPRALHRGCTGTCMWAAQDEIRQPAGAATPYLNELAGDDRMTLYEVLRFP